ncbi:ATP-binding protein [Zoogloea sp.]|uniref:ATP-binding protein n=1 Tax=Zoogloea sp. TaxID=49181 RepID=UPI0026014177|nr:ATP-binding protein [Zoogloea sp.]MCK6394656.1 ATP-binding protein [Zoogloea sp.]
MPLPLATHAPSSPVDALRRLINLRWLSISSMLLVVVLVPWLLDIPIPARALLPVAGALVLINLLSLLRVGGLRDVHPAELFLQLSADLAAWSVFLYYTGGATNPLISLLLPLVAIGAATLTAPFAWAMAALAVAAYSVLWDFNEQLDIYDSGLAVHWHLAGMWLTFALSAGVIVWYVVRMTAAIRSRDLALAEAREARLRNERIVALGNLAAGAAHELGTPLGTMAILAGELARNPSLDDEVRADAELLREQVGNCKAILAGLTLRAGSLRAEGGEVLATDQWLRGIIERWRRLRPHVPLTTTCQCGDPAPRLVADATLEQAIHNIINNAADVSPNGVECEVGVEEAQIVVRVLDRGPGLPPGFRPGPERPLDGNSDGLGIGLLLAFDAVERCSGSIAFSPRPGGGTIATLTLPLSALRP